MTSEIYWINDPAIGEKKIGTMARPRGDDWLEDEIKGLKLQQVDCLISLLEWSEIDELALQEEEAFCKKWEIEFINFPIEDVTVPNQETPFIQLTQRILDRINQNKKVVIHCRAGIGRSSILAAAVLIKAGFKVATVFEVIATYRKSRVPDTEEQKAWIFSLKEKLKP